MPWLLIKPFFVLETDEKPSLLWEWNKTQEGMQCIAEIYKIKKGSDEVDVSSTNFWNIRIRRFLKIK